MVEMNDTNQIIHKRLMGGECYHDWATRVIEGDDYLLKCSKCPATRVAYDDDEQPKYDSDLNACFAAQAKAIERFGDAYINELVKIMYPEKDRWCQEFTYELFDEQETTVITSANAEQRCAAIVKLLEEE